MFERINIERWRQFNNVDIDLRSATTVVTGANGAGKTTILNILSRHFGWNLQWTSTRSKKKSKSKFWSDVWDYYDSSFTPKTNTIKIGDVYYSKNAKCELHVPLNVNEQYQVNYQGLQNVAGIYIPSHAQPFSYQRVQNIPADPKTSSQHFQDYQNILMQVYQSTKAQNPGLVIKSSIIALAVFGYGNAAVAENYEFVEIFESFQRALRILLPKELGFNRIEIRMPDVVLITDSGDFSLDSVSGGIGALIGIAWQILMYGIDKNEYVVTFDEPENHLHPAMQRELLLNLERAFPKAKFIISTHSPFIVTSNPHAKIYALKFKDNKVVSRHIKEAELSGDYNETLQEILDVPLTIPKWVEQTAKELYKRVTIQGATEEAVRDFKEQLQRIGLYPQLSKMVNKLEDDDA